MLYTSDVNRRAFQALLDGSKRVEIRTCIPSDPLDYSLLQVGDLLRLSEWPPPSSREIQGIIDGVRHYSSAYTLFENEGITRTCSSNPTSINEAVDRIHALTDYKQAIIQHGLFAIELKEVELVHE